MVQTMHLRSSRWRLPLSAINGGNATITDMTSSELLAVISNSAGQVDQTDFIDNFLLA